MSDALRVGIVGARRARQGLGPFIARDLVRAGARVVAVLGTTADTAEDAARGVERAAGARPAAAADPAAFFAERLDAVCVLSPAGTHLQHVEASLERGCHVLCEKPLAWFPESDWFAAAVDLEDRFAARGLELAENAQWPFVLPAFEALTGHPTGGARSLAMGLAPSSTGRQMVGDALPHPLSVAQALQPSLDSVGAMRFERRSDRVLTVRATLTGRGASLDLEVHLEGDAREQPRAAWLSIDGRRAERCVRTSDYALFLRSGAELVDLPDPLTARVKDFVDAVERRRRARGGAAGAASPADRVLSRRAAMLARLVAAYDVAPR